MVIALKSVVIIKDACLEEIVTGYLCKAGEKSISDKHLVNISEISAETFGRNFKFKLQFSYFHALVLNQCNKMRSKRPHMHIRL